MGAGALSRYGGTVTDPGLPAAQESRREGPRRAIGLARAKLMAGERLDINGIAAELGIDRTTLFRWVGNRDQFVVSAIISITVPTLRNLIAAAPESGGAKIAWVAGEYARASIEPEWFRSWLEADPERALRLLTSKASHLQRHVVAEFEQLLEHEYGDRPDRAPLPIPDLSYLILRIVESFVFSDLISGDEPDWTNVRPAVAALLRPA